jgi:phosphoglycerate dehydrogenase-like enzyme
VPKERFLIPHDFQDSRYHPGWDSVPYNYTGAYLRDEILKHAPSLEVIWAQTEEETLEHIVNTDFMASDKMRRRYWERADKLRWVHISSAGADHFFKRSEVSADEFRRHGVVITTSVGAGSVVIAEQVLCYMLMFSRNMIRAVRQHMEHRWERYAGGELRGSTLGIIGLGTIGSRVAYLAKAFEMYVIGTKREAAKHDGVADEVLPAPGYGELLRRSDFVLLSCPITTETRNLINSDTLRLMKRTAYLLNVGRGECVDEAALVEALKSGSIAGYGADNHGQAKEPITDENLEMLSPQSELWGMSNVIVTPNCAVAGGKRYMYMAEIIADNYNRLKAGRELRTRLVWEGQEV